MKAFSSLLTAFLLLQSTWAVKTTFGDDGEVCEVTGNYETSYPASVTAPSAADGPGPQSDPFPAPQPFSKAALLAAHTQALRKHGSGATYPKAWISNGQRTEYMEFPIMVNGAGWTGGDPGRFRILYKASDNTFYKVAVHMSSQDMSKMQTYGRRSIETGLNRRKCDPKAAQKPAAPAKDTKILR
jgi:hypothetical protein